MTITFVKHISKITRTNEENYYKNTKKIAYRDKIVGLYRYTNKNEK